MSYLLFNGHKLKDNDERRIKEIKILSIQVFDEKNI